MKGGPELIERIYINVSNVISILTNVIKSFFKSLKFKKKNKIVYFLLCQLAMILKKHIKFLRDLEVTSNKNEIKHKCTSK